MRLVFFTAALLVATGAPADRAPVLKQIKVPHDYYYREMYLPQLTSGPGAPAWSPDGKWLVYSMQGDLWKQRIDSNTAQEITDGPGYDYQPDWSPDGKTVVFVRYLHDAMELWAAGADGANARPLTASGDVNLEPRWSPDGKRIAFVSTRSTGHFHIFIGTFSKTGFTAAPWSRERESKIARYYYSPFDQQLSPSWSPDGRELVYVDNPEMGYGSGSLWRRRVDRKTPPRLVHREETNWKAAPDWSPDGRRILYSSYAGRQTNQLWMVTARGDDYPLPLTFGDYDATRPRWSPDASRIAYISNANRNTQIWIQDAAGGMRHALENLGRRYKRKLGVLDLTIADEDGNPMPARVSVVGSDGRSYAPDDALMRGDDSFDRGVQGFETHYFQTGTAPSRIVTAIGQASVTVWGGDGHAIARQSVRIDGGKEVTIALHKLDLPAGFAAWQSADVHVHMNYGGTYRSEPGDLVAQAKAEGLDLVFDLLVNKEQRVPDIAYFSPLPDAASAPGVLLAHSQEYHSSYWGHLGLLGLDDHYLTPGYAAYPYTGAASLYPDNAAIADLAHAQHALAGYVHPFDVAPDPDRDGVITNELPIDVALGKIDYYEVVGFSNHRESASIWYRLLNCGFRLAAAGGTDAMTNYASLRGPVGLARVYVLPDHPVDTSPLAKEQAWLGGLKAGHSMATNGPLLGFTLEGRNPGDEVALPAGGGELGYQGWLRSLTGIDHLEVVLNGKAVRTVALDGGRNSADIAGRIKIAESGWLLLRAWNDHATPDVFDLYPYATTNPVFVSVAGKPLRSKDDAAFFLKWIARVKASAEASRGYNTKAERDTVLGHIDDARRVFERQLKSSFN